MDEVVLLFPSYLYHLDAYGDDAVGAGAAYDEEELGAYDGVMIVDGHVMAEVGVGRCQNCRLLHMTVVKVI